MVKSTLVCCQYIYDDKSEGEGGVMGNEKGGEKGKKFGGTGGTGYKLLTLN